MNIHESIFSKDGRLVMAAQASRSSSDADSISTYVRRQPYESTCAYGDVYSVLNYVSSDETTDLLNSVKGKGPYVVNDAQLERFINTMAAACSSLMSRLSIDVIISPKSSSELVNKFVHALQKNNNKLVVLTDAFMKRAFDAEKVGALINMDHPYWQKFSDNNPGAVSKLTRSLEKQIKDNAGHIEIKKLYKPYAKFIKNFLELQDAYTCLEMVMGKNVMVIDDVYSSGSTMVEMMRQLKEFEPASVQGLTIFKRTKTTA